MIVKPEDVRDLHCPTCNASEDVEVKGCGEPDTMACDVCECYIENGEIVISRYQEE